MDAEPIRTYTKIPLNGVGEDDPFSLNRQS